MEIFAKRLKKLREDAGLTVSELGKALNIGSSSISRWENAQADIKGQELVRLAKFFEVTTDYLLGL